MPTTIIAPGVNNTTMRWKEPYVSAGLNKKNVGPIPSGIVRGGKLQTSGAGLNVDIVPDPSTGDSVYTYRTPGGEFQLTHREDTTRTLDLSAVANSTVYVALYVQYAIGSATLVEWRTYTEAELFTGPLVAEAGSVVIVGKVDVPAAGPIPASNVTPEGARFAWKDVSAGMKPWRQIVRNGGFEDGGSTSGANGFSIEESLSGGGFSRVDNVDQHSGDWELEVRVTSTGDTFLMGPGGFQSANPFSAGPIPVVAGQLIDASFWLRGDSIDAGYTQGASGARLVFEIYDSSASLVATESVDSDPSVHVGTFAYTKLQKVFEVPVSGFMRWYLSLSIDSGSGIGNFGVDDIEIYLQPDAGDGGESAFTNGPVRTTALDLLPRNADNIADFIGTFNWYRFVVDYLNFQPRLGLDGGTNNRLLYLFEMVSSAIDLPDNGYGVIGSDASPNADTGATGYKLLGRFSLFNGVGNGDARLYGSTLPSNRHGFHITLNARWDTGTSLWDKDDDSQGATKFEIFRNGIRQSSVGSGTDSWDDSSWDRETSLNAAADGDIEFFNSVQRKKFIPLMYIANNSITSSGSSLTIQVEQTSNYYAFTNAGGFSQFVLDVPTFLPNKSQLVDVQMGVGANDGGNVSLILNRNVHDTVTIPVVLNNEWSDFRYYENYVFTGTESRHMKLSDGANEGIGLPHTIDLETYDYQIEAIFSGVNEFVISYCFIVYNDFTPGS